MFATVRIYAGNTDLVDALIANEGEVRQLIAGIDGFKSYYLLRTGDGAASVSVYEDQAGAAASDAAARAWVAENLPELHVAPPQIAAGEVVLGF